MSEQISVTSIRHYTEIFNNFNMNKWSYMKNRLDFEQIYKFDKSIYFVFDDLYAIGRDTAIGCRELLNRLQEEFENKDSDIYKSTISELLSFIDERIMKSNLISQKSENLIKNNNINLASINGMISLHFEQNGYLNNLKQLIII